MERDDAKRPRILRGIKQAYEKPQVVSEQMFETSALACGKCAGGPYPQLSCITIQSGS